MKTYKYNIKTQKITDTFYANIHKKMKALHQLDRSSPLVRLS